MTEESIDVLKELYRKVDWAEYSSNCEKSKKVALYLTGFEARLLYLSVKEFCKNHNVDLSYNKQ